MECPSLHARCSRLLGVLSVENTKSRTAAIKYESKKIKIKIKINFFVVLLHVKLVFVDLSKNV
jgi:hypothetical protein